MTFAFVNAFRQLWIDIISMYFNKLGWIVERFEHILKVD
jgi:hypothetical protein